MGFGFCKQCNKECSLIEDEGEKVCMECGTVVSENRAVETMEFEESGGGFRVVGTRVDKYGTLYGGNRMGYSRPSSEVTLNRARQNIEDVVHNLKMPEQIIKGATRLYKLLLSDNFTRGRKTTHMISAIIYATCRMNKPQPLPYMLIDFADYFSVNVFELGHTYLRLSEALTLELPLMDPSIFVPRFARELHFDAKEHKISKLAIRLVARMKRDWIVTGRRPGGICAAAVLIAARLNGFVRSVEEVALVVHLSTTTIRKRLQEFRETSTCNLTPVEFDAILDFDDIAASDPPAFTRSRKEAERLRNQPLLSLEEMEKNIRDALGVLTPEQVKNITISPVAPLNSRKQEAFEGNDEPPNKIPKLSGASSDFGYPDEEEFDSLNPEQFIYDDTLDNEEDEVEEAGEPEIESLSDIDDEEIDSLINNESEVRMNEIIWQNMYSDWEEKQKEKEELEREEGIVKKPSTPRRKEPKRAAESPVEAVATALSRRMVSSKINQAAIEKLVQASVNVTKPRNPLLDFVKLPPPPPPEESAEES